MAESPPERLINQFKRRASIHLHVKVKRPKKPHQQSYQNTEATKVNTIMKQLEDLDGNRHGFNTNNNKFAPLFEPDNEEGTNHRNKPKTLIIVLSEYEEEEKTKEKKTRITKKTKTTGERRKWRIQMTLIVMMN